MKAKSRLISWSPPSNDAVTIDDILIYLGEFGLYQKALFGMLAFFCTFVVFVYFTQLFLTVVPMEYWCKLPQIAGMSTERLRLLMIPSSKRVPYEGHQLPYSRCWMHDLPIEKIIAAGEPDESWPLRRCNTWEFKYANEDVPYASIATEQNWVCDQAYKATLAQSIFFVGAIFGGFVFGRLSDMYGRVPVLIGTNMMGFIGGVATIFVNAFWQFCLCRFIVGLAYDNTFVIAYILVLEYVGPTWRTFAANMSYGIFYTLAAIALPWMAYGIANWRTLALVTSVPLASALVTPWVVPESVRWLISKGKIEKAVRIMTRIEKINRTDVPQEIYEDFLDDCMEATETRPEEQYTVADLFKTKRLRIITLLLTISWSLIQMAYDGHVRCIDSLGMDVFTTFTIASATEFPAEVLITFTLDVLGRRWMLFGSVIFSGLFSFLAASVPIGIYFASYALVGRFFINVSSNIALQYAAELLPTVVRGEGVAFIHIMGYVASILSPFVAFTSRIQYNLPMIILGLASITAALLCLFLPETLKEQLPQTMLDGELFGKDQKFWETPFTKKKPPLDSRSHHLHAKHPVSTAALLRSSMVSGYLGNQRRLNAARQRKYAAGIRPRRSQLAVATTPGEYVDILRQKYRDNRKKLEQRERLRLMEKEKAKENAANAPRVPRTKFADEVGTSSPRE